MAPLSYTRPAPPGIGGQGGPGNYWVPVSFVIFFSLAHKLSTTPFKVYHNKHGALLPFFPNIGNSSFIFCTDRVPALILWFFDSRGEQKTPKPSTQYLTPHAQAASHLGPTRLQCQTGWIRASRVGSRVKPSRWKEHGDRLPHDRPSPLFTFLRKQPRYPLPNGNRNAHPI